MPFVKENLWGENFFMIFFQNQLTLFFVLGNIILVGGHSEVAIPVPVPNTEVKHLCVDDTANRGKVENCQLFLF